ncbi:cyclodeaminase [Nordella sp. HKS 07]|uniref:cyclodeaminase n=1 Tax=Nordella sp. HKS 07 TaxID=2712222 RepID=UPI0019D2A163|nr:cyclodeaminase [Nordella sp. HKS 07]
MSDIAILTEADLRRAVTLGAPVLAAVEEAFRLLASGKVIMPPILSMEIAEANGEVDVKTAYLPGFDHFAIKVSPGFFDNPKLGLPSLNGLMILFSAKTGLVTALLLDNGYLTDIRTAAAGAIATKYLAPKKIEAAAVLGTGAQARLQIIAAHQMRPFSRVLVWGRDRARAEACAEDIAAALKINTEAVPDAAAAVAAAQLVVTATSARKPILRAEWLHKGMHITAMGADQAGKNEIDPRAVALADLYVCDRVSQASALGELRAARAATLMNGTNPPELGAIVAGTHPGRTSETAITICDLTGTGAQDTAIASYAFAAAQKLGIGAKIKA